MKLVRSIAPVAAVALVVLGSAALRNAQPRHGIAAAATTASPWVQYGYNGARSNANLAEKTLTTANVKTVTYLRSVAAPPIIGDQACEDSRLSIASPIVVGTQLFDVSSGTLSAFVLTTGVAQWHVTPEARRDVVYEALASADGLVFVGYQDCESASAPSGEILAYKATTGAPVWSYSVEGLNGIAVSGDYVVPFGTNSNDGAEVDVLKAATGALVWTRDLPVGGGPAIIEGGQVVHQYVDPSTGEGDGIEADALTTGKETWIRTDVSLIRGETDAVATGHHLYSLTASGSVVDLNPKSGSTKFTMPGATTIEVASPTLVFGDCTGGKRCAYNIADGSLAWQETNPSGGEPSIWANGILFMTDGSAVNATTGAIITSSILQNGGPTIIANGYILVKTDLRIIDIYGLPGK